MKALYKKGKMFRNYSKEMFSNLLVFEDRMLKEHMEMIYVTHIKFSYCSIFFKDVTAISSLTSFKLAIQYSLWWVGM